MYKSYNYRRRYTVNATGELQRLGSDPAISRAYWHPRIPANHSPASTYCVSPEVPEVCNNFSGEDLSLLFTLQRYFTERPTSPPSGQWSKLIHCSLNSHCLHPELLDGQ